MERNNHGDRSAAFRRNSKTNEQKAKMEREAGMLRLSALQARHRRYKLQTRPVVSLGGTPVGTRLQQFVAPAETIPKLLSRKVGASLVLARIVVENLRGRPQGPPLPSFETVSGLCSALRPISAVPMLSHD